MTTRLRNKLVAYRDQIRDAYLNGATLRSIGDVHDVSAGTVRNLLLEMGVSMRPRGRRSKAAVHNPRILPLEGDSSDDSKAGKYEGPSFD